MTVANDIKPAGYSKQSKSETKSINILNTLLDEKHVASYLSKNDKTPNHDGNLDLIVDDIPFGKLEVQIKTLRANYSKPSYSISLTLLAYIRDAQLPFLFIAVDQSRLKAFWYYIERQTAKNLIDIALEKKEKQKTIAIKFENDNEISCNPPYIRWKKIVLAQLELLKRAESLDENLVLDKETITTLEAKSSDKRSEFQSVNLFLDKFNNLLNDDFVVVKLLFAKNFWKFGIVTFGEITDNGIAYSLFFIDLDENILSIRTLPQDEFQTYIQNLQLVTAYSGSNPIHANPRQYGYQKIWEYLKILLERKILMPDNEVLKNEFLFSLKSKSFREINETNPTMLSLIDFKNQIEQVLEKLPQSHKDLMIDHPYSEGNLFVALNYIQDYRMKNMERINRISPSRFDLFSVIDKVNIDNIEISTFHSNFKDYFTKLYQVYEEITEYYFPNLISELSLKKYRFILIPVIVEVQLPKNNSLKLIQFELFKVENSFVTIPDKILIESEIKNITINFNNGLLTHNGINYLFIERTTFQLSSIIKDLPIREGVFSLLRKNLDQYFKKIMK